MRQVYKYTLQAQDEPQYHLMLRGAEIVYVACQSDYRTIQFWAVIDIDAGETELRTFHVRGTGHDIPDGPVYVGSTLAAGGALVWHLFEGEA